MSLALDEDIRVHVVQGQCRIGSVPHLMLTTTLGSCIAACIRDPVAKVGGMNHFLLPDVEGVAGAASLRYGGFAMESLINELLKAGCVRERLVAKLFGGGRLSSGAIDIGRKNAVFASEYLRREGIREEPGSLGGEYARRVQFWPASGRVRQLVLTRPVDAVPRPASIPAQLAGRGDFELF
jgi:chemotaxis protein CheD